MALNFVLHCANESHRRRAPKLNFERWHWICRHCRLICSDKDIATQVLEQIAENGQEVAHEFLTIQDLIDYLEKSKYHVSFFRAACNFYATSDPSLIPRLYSELLELSSGTNEKLKIIMQRLYRNEAFVEYLAYLAELQPKRQIFASENLSSRMVSLGLAPTSEEEFIRILFNELLMYDPKRDKIKDSDIAKIFQKYTKPFLWFQEKMREHIARRQAELETRQREREAQRAAKLAQKKAKQPQLPLTIEDLPMIEDLEQQERKFCTASLKLLSKKNIGVEVVLTFFEFACSTVGRYYGFSRRYSSEEQQELMENLRAQLKKYFPEASPEDIEEMIKKSIETLIKIRLLKGKVNMPLLIFPLSPIARELLYDELIVLIKKKHKNE